MGLAIEKMLSEGVDTMVLSELPELRTVSYWNRDEGLLEHELEVNRELVKVLSEIFDKQNIVYIPGNHDERLDGYLKDKAPALKRLRGMSVYELTDMDKFGWQYHDNKQYMRKGEGPLRIGRLNFIHGHEVKAGWGAVNIAKIYYDRCRSNVIIGHHHRAEEKVVRTVTNKYEGAWCVGCMCELNPNFMPHNDWVHGFAIVKFYDDGFFRVINRKIMNGRIL
jgi:hypothetical protein